MQRKSVWLVVLLAALTAATPAAAQRGFEQLNLDSRGKGNLKVGKAAPNPLNQAIIDLQRGGEAVIRLSGREPATFTGRWTRGQADEVNLDLRGGLGGRVTSGTGKLFLRRGGSLFFSRRELDRLEMTGRAKDEPFNLVFNAEDSDTAAGDRLRQLDQSVRGTGFLDLEGRRDEDLQGARVILDRDGDAVIRLRGSRSIVFGGSWTSPQSGVVDLKLTEAFTGETATGKGRITLNARNELERIDLSGTARNRDFSTRFTVREVLTAGETTRRELDRTYRGTGFVDLQNTRDQEMRRAHIILDVSGQAYLRFTADDKFTFGGRWFAQDDNTVEVAIRAMQGGKRAVGSAKIHFVGDEIQRTELTARNDRQSYTLRFNVASRVDDDDPDTADYRNWEGGGEGSGTLQVAQRDEQRLERVRVILRSNQEAAIRFYGEDRSYTLAGTWSGDRRSEVTVRIRQYEGAPADGTARVTFARSLFVAEPQVREVTVDGTVNGRRIDAQFRVR